MGRKNTRQINKTEETKRERAGGTRHMGIFVQAATLPGRVGKGIERRRRQGKLESALGAQNHPAEKEGELRGRYRVH